MPAVPLALAGPAPEVGAVVAVLLVALALVARTRRPRAMAMSGALLLAPVLLVADIWDSPQMEVVREHPLAAAGAAVVGIGAISLLAALMLRKPLLLPVLTVIALPFRIPIEVGGETSNLLVPLYLVIAAGALAFVVPALRADPELPEDDPDPDDETGPPARRWEPGWLERLLALSIVLYGVQATYSGDFDKALQQLAFFYVPFALLFVLLAQIRWTPQLLKACFGVLVALALAFSAIGYVEYATRHIFLNPKLIASNELHTYFRTNSVFFDPNIYGRFLVVAMLAVAAAMLRTARTRLIWIGAAVLLALWAGLVLTLSQSSYVALLAGLATLALLQWGVRRTLLPVGGVLAAGVALVLIAPGAVGVDLNNLDASTSGRSGLVEGGGELFVDKPIAGHGAGGFEQAYADTNRRPAGGDASTASHTIPITVAAEQGAIGLVAYLALLVVALARLLRDAAGSPARAAIAAAFVALVVHTLIYAAFLEDPLTWALLGVGTALAAQTVPELRRRRAAAEAGAAQDVNAPDGERRSAEPGASLPAT
jgi:O-antigen ligase